MRILLCVLALSFVSCQHVPAKLYVRADCTETDTSLQDAEFSVDVRQYVGGSSRLGAILIMPPTGGMTVLDRNMGSKLCRAGFDVYVLKHWSGQDESASDLELHQRLYTRGLRAIGLVLKPIPEGFVGMMGTSVGATFTVVAMNQIERLKAAFVIVGGEPLREVIAQSDHESMRKLHRERFEQFHFKDDEQYALAVGSVFPLDADKNPPLFRGKKLGMVLATEDTTVPTPLQRRLKDYWQPQTVIEIEASHFWAIVKGWWWHDGDIVQFFSDAAAAG